MPNLGKVVEQIVKQGLSLIIKLAVEIFHAIKMNRFYSKSRKGID